LDAGGVHPAYDRPALGRLLPWPQAPHRLRQVLRPFGLIRLAKSHMLTPQPRLRRRPLERISNRSIICASYLNTGPMYRPFRKVKDVELSAGELLDIEG
jgi:hypothetical protein